MAGHSLGNNQSGTVYIIVGLYNVMLIQFSYFITFWVSPLYYNMAAIQTNTPNNIPYSRRGHDGQKERHCSVAFRMTHYSRKRGLVSSFDSVNRDY